MTESCPLPLSLLTCVSLSSPVALQSTEDLQTWLQQDSPVSHSAQPVKQDTEPTTVETCGRPQSNAFAWYDQSTHCWRTFQACLLVDILEPFSETWPRQGMTVNGQYFPLAPLMPHIHGKDCSYWPTPMAAERLGGSSAAMAQRSLNGEKRKSGANIAKKVGDLLKLRYGMPKRPIFYEWLMGWVPRWTALEPLETGRFQRWLEQHGNY